MKEQIIGILGGMGPEATKSLFEAVIKNTPATKDQDHLRIIIDNNPKVPDRTAAILGQGEDPLPEMLKSAHSLERAGADFIIIPCMSAHFFLERLQAEISLPIMCAIENLALMMSRYQPPIKAVGLLATSGSIQGGLFQKKLGQKDIRVLTPAQDMQEKVMDVIYTIKGDTDGAHRKECKQKFVDVANALMDQGAEGIIAGCTEVPLALDPEDIQVPLFDPLTVLAQAAVSAAKQGAE